MSNDTAERILDVARQLMVTRGYNAFSYADIAEVVKVSKPSIHFHFATKAVLVQKLLVRYRANTKASLEQASALLPDPLARLRAYTGYWEDCIRNDNAPFCVCALLASELPSLPAEVAAEVRLYFRDLSAWLAATLEEGAAQGQLALRRGAAAEAQSFMACAQPKASWRCGAARRRRPSPSWPACTAPCCRRGCTAKSRCFQASSATPSPG